MTTISDRQEAVAQRIAGKVFLGELAAARALGYPERAAIKSAFAALDESYLRAFEADRPAVWQQPRIIRKPAA